MKNWIGNSIADINLWLPVQTITIDDCNNWNDLYITNVVAHIVRRRLNLMTLQLPHVYLKGWLFFLTEGWRDHTRKNILKLIFLI